MRRSFKTSLLNLFNFEKPNSRERVTYATFNIALFELTVSEIRVHTQCVFGYVTPSRPYAYHIIILMTYFGCIFSLLSTVIH